MKTKLVRKAAGRFLMSLAATYAAYNFVIRPWHLKWGARGMEAREPLPGDELVEHPRLVSTRAITINAPAGDVWPWLAQLGQGRGGFYSYSRLEKMMGADIENADRIIPELQRIGTGDVIHLAPDKPEGQPTAPLMYVSRADPQRSLVLVSRVDLETLQTFDESDPLPGKYAFVSWSFFLQSVDESMTRLIVRTRIYWSPGLSNFILWRVLTEPAHFIMERAMLLGIRKRAEMRAAVEPEAGAPSGEEQRAA